MPGVLMRLGGSKQSAFDFFYAKEGAGARRTFLQRQCTENWMEDQEKKRGDL